MLLTIIPTFIFSSNSYSIYPFWCMVCLIDHWKTSSAGTIYYMHVIIGGRGSHLTHDVNFGDVVKLNQLSSYSTSRCWHRQYRVLGAEMTHSVNHLVPALVLQNLNSDVLIQTCRSASSGGAADRQILKVVIIFSNSHDGVKMQGRSWVHKKRGSTCNKCGNLVLAALFPYFLKLGSHSSIAVISTSNPI